MKELRKMMALAAFVVIAVSTVLVGCSKETEPIITEPVAELAVGDTFEGNFTTYKVMGIDDSYATLNMFAVGEDDEAIYVYYEISSTHEKSVVLTTIQDTVNAGPVTGVYTWGWSEVARNYGEAENAFEIKISMNDSTGFSGTDMISNVEDDNIQLMYTNGENKILAEGNVDTSLGDVYGAGNVIEMKIFKNALEGVGMPVLSAAASLRFCAGAYHMTGWGQPAPDGAHGYFPAENVGSALVYMLPYSDPTSAVYTGGQITGVVSTDPTSLQGTEAALVATNVTVTLVDPDSAATSVDVTVESSADSGTTTFTLSGANGVFTADLGLVSAVGNVTATAINFDPTGGVVTTIDIIFTDASTTEVTTNSFTVQPFYSLDGEIVDGIASASYVNDLTSGEAAGDTNLSAANMVNSGMDIIADPKYYISANYTFLYFPLPEAAGSRHIEIDLSTNDTTGTAMNSWSKPRTYGDGTSVDFPACDATFLSWDGTGAGIAGLLADSQGAADLMVAAFATDTSIEVVFTNIDPYKFACYTANGDDTGIVVDQAGVDVVTNNQMIQFFSAN